MKEFIKDNWPALLSLIYVLSPIDFIPEFILGPLGIVDDGFLVGTYLLYRLVQYAFKDKSSDRVKTEGRIK